MTFAAIKHYLVAAILAIVAAGVAALALYARSQKARAEKLTAARDQALRQAANARVGRALYKETAQAAEQVRVKAAAAPPPDTVSHDDFDSTF